MTTKKITLDDVKPTNIKQAQKYVHMIVQMQTSPECLELGEAVLRVVFEHSAKITAPLVSDDLLVDNVAYTQFLNQIESTLFCGVDESVPAETKKLLCETLAKVLASSSSACLAKDESPITDLSEAEHIYTGVFWGWWLVRYLIAHDLGTEMDISRLALLLGFVRYCPNVGRVVTPTDPNRLVVLPRPTEVSLIATGTTTDIWKLPIYELHNEAAPSITHPNFTKYHWHNTEIPERMGKVPSSEWKPEWVTDEKNSEIRTILIREIGVEKLLHMGTVIDSYENYSDKWVRKSEYQLIDMAPIFDNEEVTYAPYLRMTNQTTGAIHLEGVPPEVRTITQALEFRTGIDFSKATIESIH